MKELFTNALVIIYIEIHAQLTDLFLHIRIIHKG